MCFVEGRPSGRLLRYDPATGSTHVLARHLMFANGVALSPDQDFVVVAESFRMRLQRYNIKGPKAGTLEQFGPILPGCVRAASGVGTACGVRRRDLTGGPREAKFGFKHFYACMLA